jgi:hypothetical protein
MVFNSSQNLSKFRHVNYVSKYVNLNNQYVSLISSLYLLTYLISLDIPTAEMSAKIPSSVCVYIYADNVCVF